MSLPYFPLFPADFEADTSHLTLEEDGAYNRLLRLMWMTPGCSLPDDDAWIARRMRCDAETFARAVAPVISEFLERAKGRVFSPRLLTEFKKADKTSRKRSDAGKKGGRPKGVENKQETEKPGFSDDKAGLSYTRPCSEPEPDKKEEEPNGSLSSDDLGEAVRMFNAAASEAGWPKVQVLSKSRASSLKARLRECGGLTGWEVVLAKARASPLCNGQNNRGWTASFDFLVQQSSFQKLMEGNYDARPSTATNGRMAGGERPGSGGQRGSIASIAAQRAADRQRGLAS